MIKPPGRPEIPASSAPELELELKLNRNQIKLGGVSPVACVCLGFGFGLGLGLGVLYGRRRNALYILQFEQPLVAPPPYTDVYNSQRCVCVCVLGGGGGMERGDRGGVASIIRGVLRHQANKQAAHKQRTVKITSMEAIMARAPFYEPRN